MQITPRPRQLTHNLSTSSNAHNLELPDDPPPAMSTRSHTHSNASSQSTPVKIRIFLPQVTFQPLPVLQEGEGLEVDKSEKGITINFVDGDISWTLVQRRKKKKAKKDNKSEKWNVQQKENFECFGDIYQGVPYKSYRNVDIGPPVANIPLQQPAAQQPIAPQAPIVAAPVQPPIIPPAPGAVAAAASSTHSRHTSTEADYTRQPKASLASDHSRRRRRQSAGAAKSKIPELLLLRQFQHTS
jgi:hypothetical protein